MASSGATNSNSVAVWRLFSAETRWTPADDYVTDWPNRVSYQRRVLYVLPDGRKVLQDTNTSMEDFVKAVWSPGWVPDSLGR